ncbi:MAG: hypothetical protein JXA22_00740 [Candidatus Thermoplasmatota archaeon]|nr:hypothetical protein [Candidatus Thermoplasmatota archaeon]
MVADRIGKETGLPNFLAAKEQHCFLVHVEPAVSSGSPKGLSRDGKSRMKYLARKLKAVPCIVKVKLTDELSLLDLTYHPIA